MASTGRHSALEIRPRGPRANILHHGGVELRSNLPLPPFWVMSLRVDSTSKAFFLWENLNEKLISFLKVLIERVRLNYLRLKIKLGLTKFRTCHEMKKKTKFLQPFSRVNQGVETPFSGLVVKLSLQEQIVLTCSNAQKIRILETLPEVRIIYFKRKKSERIIANFLSAWTMYRRARAQPGIHDHSILVLCSQYNRGSTVNGSRCTQVCWALGRESIETLYKLFKHFERTNFEYMNVELSSSSVLYILWLVNPAVLIFLLFVFLSCDIVVPKTWTAFRKLMKFLKTMISRDKYNPGDNSRHRRIL